jgi:hypothetical protein
MIEVEEKLKADKSFEPAWMNRASGGILVKPRIKPRNNYNVIDASTGDLIRRKSLKGALSKT